MVTKAKFIPAASVQIGDVIRVTFKEDRGVIVTHTAAVAKREYEGTDRVLYTAEGREIFRWNPAHKPPRVTLLVPASQGEMMLEGLELWSTK